MVLRIDLYSRLLQIVGNMIVQDPIVGIIPTKSVLNTAGQYH